MSSPQCGDSNLFRTSQCSGHKTGYTHLISRALTEVIPPTKEKQGMYVVNGTYPKIRLGAATEPALPWDE